ncbi:ATPase [Lachnospiraceae bacterium ZAX-1]
MVEKMKLLHITGSKYDIDRVMRVYLGKYDIHFENASTSLNTFGHIHPFTDSNAYKEVLTKGSELLSYLTYMERTQFDEQKFVEMEPKTAETIIDKNCVMTLHVKEEQQVLSVEEKGQKELMAQLRPFRSLDFEFHKIRDFRFILVRFGRISQEYYYKMAHYISQSVCTLFCECQSDQEFVWGAYFVPHSHAEEIDAVLLSFHFEQVELPDTIEETIESTYLKAENRCREIEQEMERLSAAVQDILRKNQAEIWLAYYVLERYCANFEIHKFAAVTISTEDLGEQYILYAWLPSNQAKKLLKETQEDDKIQCIEEESAEMLSDPPIRLKNPKILKPFEMFVEMYGLPAYNEMDPTLFIALTYTFIFGIMFGDVGQGLCLVFGGLALYKLKGVRLAGIISIAGIWSTFFGVMYGSLFGFETVIPAVWRHPNEPENIMSTLLLAVGFGAFLIIVAMIINIMNAIRAKEYGRLLFDPSGLAGIICYGFVAICVVLFVNMKSHPIPATIAIVVVVGLPLIAIFMKEPLMHLVEKKGHAFPEGSKAMFFVEAFVEWFEIVLSYATNTISFVRIGAFALSHAGMMGVVLSLAGAENGGTPNWIVVVIGNIVVAGLEGLVVGIQVLRLEYYEMFSRFYKGSGKLFQPFNQHEK